MADGERLDAIEPFRETPEEGHTPEYIIRARHIVGCMSGNHWFPTPEPSQGVTYDWSDTRPIVVD